MRAFALISWGRANSITIRKRIQLSSDPQPLAILSGVAKVACQRDHSLFSASFVEERAGERRCVLEIIQHPTSKFFPRRAAAFRQLDVGCWVFDVFLTFPSPPSSLPRPV